jgi:DNA-binding NarL/FixJ family response regulator
MNDLATPTMASNSSVHPSAAFRYAYGEADATAAPAPGAKVVIGTTSPLLQCGLESLVVVTGGLRLSGTAHTLDELLACCARAGDAVALIEPTLGRLPLRELLPALKAAAPQLRVVLIADTAQPHFVREAIKLGACGIVGKSADSDEIRAALLAAASGRRYIARDIAAQLAESLTLDELTQREMEVLSLLSRGDCNKIIARDLQVTVGTVKTHVRAIMCKLASRSRTEAVHKAYRLGLVCLDR